MRAATETISDLIANTPAAKGLQQMIDTILFLLGGLPVEMSSEVVGGIGAARNL